MIVDDGPIADVVQQSPEFADLYCVPATIHLAGAEIELVSLVAREQRLRTQLDAYLRHGGGGASRSTTSSSTARRRSDC